MELFFAPLSCSMASRIVADELQLDVRFVEVDPITRRTLREGDDYLAVNPLGLVPALRTDGGEVITENAAVLQHLAEQRGDAGMIPDDALGRARVRQWLCFVGTELHKGVFSWIFDREAPDAVKQYAASKAAPRLAVLEAHLSDREFLLDRFTLADAYLVTVLNWTQATPQIDLAKFPAVRGYLRRLRARPSVARALAAELPLYQQELARLAAR